MWGVCAGDGQPVGLKVVDEVAAEDVFHRLPGVVPGVLVPLPLDQVLPWLPPAAPAHIQQLLHL